MFCLLPTCILPPKRRTYRPISLIMTPLSLAVRQYLELAQQGVTKRCRLSWLTNSVLVNEPKCGGRGSCGVSANEYCTYSCTQDPNKFWRSKSIFNLSCAVIQQICFRRLHPPPLISEKKIKTVFLLISIFLLLVCMYEKKILYKL